MHMSACVTNGMNFKPILIGHIPHCRQQHDQANIYNICVHTVRLSIQILQNLEFCFLWCLIARLTNMRQH